MNKQLAQLDSMSLARWYNLGYIAGQLGRSHINNKELKKIAEDNITTEVELIRHFRGY